MSDSRLRNYWCFTYHCDDYEVAIADCKTWPTKYCLVGREVCPTTGQKHLQGYCGFKYQIRLSALKKINKRVHWEFADGDYKENWTYCTKDGDFESWGDEPMVPKETVASRDRHIVDMAIQGNLVGIVEAYPSQWMRYQRNLKDIRRDHLKLPPDNEDVCGVWIYGPAGCGKSRKARQDYPNYHHKLCNKWWDGYQDQPNVIIDDLDKNHHVLGHHLKIWADRYAFTAEVKNDVISIRPKKIIITSQYLPEDIWPNDSETVAAIRRRYEVIDISPPWEFIQNHD